MSEENNIRKNKEVFKVPENYFDEFQARMSDLTGESSAEQFSTNTNKGLASLKLAYAIPAFMVILVTAYLFFFNPEAETDLLAAVSTEDLIDYLEEDGVTEEELISYLDYDTEELEIYSNGGLLEEIDDAELDNLSDEIDVFNEYL